MTALTRGLVMLLGVVQSVLIARGLGVEGRGILAALVGFSFILVQFATLGLSTAGPWLLARNRTDRHAIAASVLWVAVGAGSVALMVGAVIALVLPAVVNGAGALSFGLALAAIPALLLIQVVPGILLGEDRMATFNVLALLTAAVPTAAVALLFAWTDPELEGLLAVTLGANTLVALIGIGVAVGRAAFQRPDRDVARRLVAYGLRVYAASVLAFLVLRIDVLFLNGIAGAEAAGYYAVAVSFADALYVVPFAIGLTLFARVAGLTGVALTRAALVRTVPAFAVLCVVAALVIGPVVRLLYGDAFGEAASYFALLAPGVFALGTASIISQHYAAVGFPVRLTIGWLAALVLNIALNAALLPVVDPRAVSVISSVTYLLVLAVHVDTFRRDLRPARETEDDTSD
jgi:O-antigen/teichoic acid export membrane protein